MLRFCSLALLCAGACATGSTDPDLQRFLDFTSTYHKTYASQAEFDHRFSVFKKTLATIDARNAAGTLGVHNVTRFADLESSEFADQNLGGRGHRAGAISKRWPAHAGKPANVDWVAKGATTPVKNQGMCGSCWAFSATEQIESDNFLKTGKLVDLAPQQVTSCDTVSDGCDGGWTYWAYDYVMSAGGIEAAASYPYVSGTTGETGSCTAVQADEIVQLSGYNNVSNSAATEPNMGAALQEGPLSVCLDATTFSTYQSGIVGAGCGTEVNHCVQATGLNTNADGVTYYIVRNSWGEDWGVDGFIYIAYGANNCEIAGDATNVVIA